MPIQSYQSFECMTSFCQTRVPTKIWDDIRPIRVDDEAVKAYGTQLCIQMCEELRAGDVPGFHFYTLNLESSVMTVLRGLGFQETSRAQRCVSQA